MRILLTPRRAAHASAAAAFVRRAVALIAALVLAVLVVPSAARADQTGLVRGTVTVDGAPVKGVAVTLESAALTRRTTTDAAGRFSFAAVPFGRYTVTVTRPGLPPATAPADVTTGGIAEVPIILGAPREIARTSQTFHAVAGTPVSENVISRTEIGALPVKSSLQRVIETVPGIVRFSYNEPVAHGFHGITYEIDGAPLPQTTSSNFAEIVDPRDIDSLEVFTGAIPAEFGGSRDGAVVNIQTKRFTDLGAQRAAGTLSFGAGNYGTAETTLTQGYSVGSATRIFANAYTERSDRGLDAPTFDPVHDAANQSGQFLRVVSNLNARDTLSADLSNQFSTYQIPINTTLGPNNPLVNVPGTDDVQREYSRFGNVVYTHASRDGNGFLQVIPWVRFNRVAYDGDLAKDLQGTFVDPETGAVTPLDGVRQDRAETVTGLRLTAFRSVSARHALKAGIEGQTATFRSNVLIAQAGQPDFFDDVAQRGSQTGAYVEDKWTPSARIAVNAGLRYDHSTGFVSGGQLSPRIGVNVAEGAHDILHFYFGRFYAAPALEDVRRDAIVIGGGSPSDQLPVYDLQPERDTYFETGVRHTFSSAVTGYINYWTRDVTNALDTTQLFPTPIFAVFNNALGEAQGLELRLTGRTLSGDSFFFSGTLSRSVAAGVTGSTFLFPPAALAPTDFQPEDHDQTVRIDTGYTKRFGAGKAFYATLQSTYGTGYPIQFENGTGRLPPYLLFNVALGREPGPGRLGFDLTAENITDHAYLLKVNNGFNTTQWGSGARFLLRLIAPLGL